MERIKEKEMNDICAKNSQNVLKKSQTGGVKDKNTLDTAKKNGSSRRTRKRKSKKIAESEDKLTPINNRDIHSSGDQSKKESKTKSPSVKQPMREKQNIKTSTKVNGTPMKKVEIKLRPSEICYSQSSISNQFTDGTNIGQLLDDIYFGRCFASAVPQIEVSQLKQKWVSADNRRLWVFKQLEVLGKIEFISVKVSKKIYSGKLTSGNGGEKIEIRGENPSGTLFPLINVGTNSAKKSKRRRRRRNKTNQSAEQKSSSTQNEGTCSNNSETTATAIKICQDNEEFVFYDSDNSDEWTDDDAPDTCPHYMWDNSWHECEKLLKSYETEKFIDDYGEYPSSISNAFEYSDNFDIMADFDEPAMIDRGFDDYSRKDFDNLKEECIPFSKSLYRDPPAQEENGLSFDGHVSDQWYLRDAHQVTPDFSYRQDHFSDICGRRDCSRCSRMVIYRDMDKGYYYEPPCPYLTARYSSSHYSARTRNTNDNTRSENSSVLSELARGLEKVVGFFNELFR